MYVENFPALEPLKTLNGEWTVEFSNKDIGPTDTITLNHLSDWTSWEDESVKFYSGTAVYRKSFELESIPEGDLFINLGQVSVMAEIKINGQEIGGTWMAPFRLNANASLRAGGNLLEIEVVNTWRNRLVKDKILPEEQRYTWLIVDDVEPDEKLQPSGLVGPVTIEWACTIP